MTEIIDPTEHIVTVNKGPRIKVTSEPNNGRVLKKLWIDDLAVTDTGDMELAEFMRTLYNLAKSHPRPNASLAMIGLGMGIMPVILTGLRNWRVFDIYEKEQSVVNHNRSVWHPRFISKWNFIVGDYEDTLAGLYDYIVYDATDEINLELLNAHLEVNGRLFIYGQEDI